MGQIESLWDLILVTKIYWNFSAVVKKSKLPPNYGPNLALNLIKSFRYNNIEDLLTVYYDYIKNWCKCYSKIIDKTKGTNIVLSCIWMIKTSFRLFLLDHNIFQKSKLDVISCVNYVIGLTIHSAFFVLNTNETK